MASAELSRALLAATYGKLFEALQAAFLRSKAQAKGEREQSASGLYYRSTRSVHDRYACFVSHSEGYAVYGLGSLYP